MARCARCCLPLDLWEVRAAIRDGRRYTHSCGRELNPTGTPTRKRPAGDGEALSLSHEETYRVEQR